MVARTRQWRPDRATITASRTRAAAASGCSATASTDEKRAIRAGICTAVRMIADPVRRTRRRDQFLASCAAPRTPATWSPTRSRSGMTGIGIADRNTVAGVVRAHAALARRATRLPKPAAAADRFPPRRRRAAGLRRRHAGHRRLSGDAPRLGPADAGCSPSAICARRRATASSASTTCSPSRRPAADRPARQTLRA